MEKQIIASEHVINMVLMAECFDLNIGDIKDDMMCYAGAGAINSEYYDRFMRPSNFLKKALELGLYKYEEVEINYSNENVTQKVDSDYKFLKDYIEKCIDNNSFPSYNELMNLLNEKDNIFYREIYNFYGKDIITVEEYLKNWYKSYEHRKEKLTMTEIDIKSELEELSRTSFSNIANPTLKQKLAYYTVVASVLGKCAELESFDYEVEFIGTLIKRNEKVAYERYTR